MCPSLYHHEISEVITNDRNDVHAKGQGQRPKVKVTEDTQFSHFRTITPGWIHIWWWNDAQSLMWHMRGDLMFFEVIHQISSSHETKICQFWPELVVSRLTVGELRSGVTGFATIDATGSHRFLVQLHAENLSHKNNYSNLANKRARI